MCKVNYFTIMAERTLTIQNFKWNRNYNNQHYKTWKETVFRALKLLNLKGSNWGRNKIGLIDIAYNRRLRINQTEKWRMDGKVRDNRVIAQWLSNCGCTFNFVKSVKC